MCQHPHHESACKHFERTPHGDKTDRPRPEVLLGGAAVVRGQARLDRVALAKVGPIGHAGLRPGRMRKHQRTAHPVGPLDDAQAIGVTVGDEDAKGERIHLLKQNRVIY